MDYAECLRIEHFHLGRIARPGAHNDVGQTIAVHIGGCHTNPACETGCERSEIRQNAPGAPIKHLHRGCYARVGAHDDIRIGIAIDLSRGDVERLTTLFQAAALPTQIKLSAVQRKKLFAAMRLDKKVSAGEIKFVLASAIGKVTWGQKVPESTIQDALNISSLSLHTSPLLS